MIELAPHHKIGLPLAAPVMIAAGFCGYGDAYQRLIDLAAFGALVTQPITLRPARGAPAPRVAETGGGFIINTGQQNPGVKKILQQYPKIWSRLPVPVIAHLPVDEPPNLKRTARALSNNAPLAALELGLPPGALAADVVAWVRSMRDGSHLPLLVKIPLDAPLAVAGAAVEAGADALVVGGAPEGAVLTADGTIIHGQFYSPALFPLTLHRVNLFRREFEVPLVAAGGIQSVAGAQILLEVGADAVQLDSLLFVDPLGAEAIAQGLALA